MVAAFAGKQYKLDSSANVNFDEYMKALGVGLITRKMGNSISPVMELTIKDDEYTLKSTSTFKNTTVTFKLGQELEQETADGRKVKTTFTLEGDTLTEVQKGDKETTIIREFSAIEVKCTMTVDDIVSTRLYRAI